LNSIKKELALILFLLLAINQLYAKTVDLSRLTPDERNNIEVVQGSVNSVVNISNIKIARSGFWFDMNATEVPAGAGSGFVWGNNGHIVTNFHVVAGGDIFTASFKGNKEQYRAKIVGVSPEKDIAVLKLEKIPKNFTPLKIGKSENLLVGQKAIAIGNPFGLDHTVSKGIISALGRQVLGIGNRTIRGMIQTDASINPGNSGGPLLNSSGELIGMNTMIYSTTGSSTGVGFALPVQTIKRIVPQLIKYGRVKRPGLGIAPLEDRYREYFGIENGVVVKYISDESGPAASIGLQGIRRDRFGRYYLGDIITKVAGVKLKSVDDIYHALDSKEIGEKVEIEYIRDRKKYKKKIKLYDISRSFN
jgi:S1-C subfamily serine protease